MLAKIQSDFVPHVINPIRSLASETIDAEAILLGVALPGRISDRVASAYEEHLFGNATLQDLPDEPRFVINATNVQSGALWRFMKPYMRDYRVGSVPNPKLSPQAVGFFLRIPSGALPYGTARESERLHSQLRLGSATQTFHQ